MSLLWAHRTAAPSHPRMSVADEERLTHLGTERREVVVASEVEALRRRTPWDGVRQKDADQVANAATRRDPRDDAGRGDRRAPGLVEQPPTEGPSGPDTGAVTSCPRAHRWNCEGLSNRRASK